MGESAESSLGSCDLSGKGANTPFDGGEAGTLPKKGGFERVEAVRRCVGDAEGQPSANRSPMVS